MAELHQLVQQTIQTITGIEAQTHRTACAALISFLTQQGQTELIVDREDLKLLVELAAIYHEKPESELLTPAFYTALAGTKGAFIRSKRPFDKDDEETKKRVNAACQVIQDLYPHVYFEESDKSKQLVITFKSAVTDVPLFSLLDWAYLEEVTTELSATVRFTKESLPTEEEKMKEIVPDEFLDDRFSWTHKGRRENYWFCKYLSMGQLYKLLTIKPEILKPNEIH